MIHAFPCGTLCLDFVGTLRARRNPVPTEKLASADMLDAWFTESGLLDASPGAQDEDLKAAVDLREAVYALVVARIAETELPREAIATVNRFASGAPVLLQLESAKDLTRARRSGATPQGLAAIAREAVEIVGGDEAGLLRECARPECTQVYLDRSHGHRREWCAMRTCGNRVKASQFRARQREAESSRA